MVLQDDRLAPAQRPGHPRAFLEVDHHAAEVVVQRVIVVERADVLGDRVEQAAQRGPGAAPGGVRVRRGVRIGPCLMDVRVDRERGPVHRVAALDDLAVMVATDQVGDADLAEMHAERVDPEGIGELRIARGDMACHALVETELREQPERGGQTLLAVQALFAGAGEHRRGHHVPGVGRGLYVVECGLRVIQGGAVR